MTANKRRTLGAALDVSPDQLAFIQGGLPVEARPVTSEFTEQAQTPKLTVRSLGASANESHEVSSRTIQLESEVLRSDSIDAEQAQPMNHQQSASQRGAIEPEPIDTIARRAKPKSRREPTAKEETYAGLTNLLVPLTTRLSPPTAAALKRAGLEQKLYGRQPGTVQEIAEEAIREWLNGQGYL